MTKLFSVSFFALGLMSSMSATAATPYPEIVDGGRLYIADVNSSIQFSFGSLTNPGVSYATNSNIVYIATLDSNGAFVDNWRQLLQTQKTPYDKVTLLPGSSSLTPVPGDSNSFTFNAGQGASELVLKWTNTDTGKTYYSSLFGRNPIDPENRNYTYDVISYFPGNVANVGLDDGGLGAGGKIHWDWNDVIFRVTNVTSSLPTPIPAIPAVPEPESWLMMLLGFSMIAGTARRRLAMR